MRNSRGLGTIHGAAPFAAPEAVVPSPEAPEEFVRTPEAVVVRWYG